MKTNTTYAIVTVSVIMIMSCACTLHEKAPMIDSVTKNATVYHPSLKCDGVLQSNVGPIEFNSINILMALKILKNTLEENNIYLSIVIDSKNIDLENTKINTKIERSELKRVLDQFCQPWDGRWELLTEDGPIILKTKITSSETTK